MKKAAAMKILIAGHGDTAVHLAKKLSRENQDVVVMGTDTGILSELDTHYNLITTYGKATSISDLKNAGAPGCDLLIAVTPNGNQNLISAQIGKWLGARTTIARIDNAELLDDDARAHLKTLGVDMTVYPEYLAARETATSISHPWMRSIHYVSGGELRIFPVRLSDNAPLEGMTLVEFGKLNHNCHIPLIRRNRQTIIPRGSDHFERHDVVYFATTGEDESEIAYLCGKKIQKINRAVVAGGGKTAIMLANMLGGSCGVTIIDPDRDKCLKISALCPQAKVVNADFRDKEIRREERLHDHCAFVALGESSETNIVRCIVANDLGAVKTIAQIEDIGYFDEAQQLDIDTVINKKLLTSSRIYQLLLDNYLDSPRCLAFEDADVVEIKARESSYITTHAVRDLRLSAEMTIAGLTRDGKGMLVGGNTRIEPGDNVVVFCLRGSLKKVERLFL